MKKSIYILLAAPILLFIFYQFYFKERYCDVLHTTVNISEYSQGEHGVKSLINWYVENYHIPAVSASIVEIGQNTIFISKGEISKNNDVPVDENSIYRIASTGKLMIATITNQLIEKGILDLNESIVTYLGDSLNQQSIKKLNGIKIENLLMHTSGLGRDWNAFTEKQIFQHLNNSLLDFKPGERWSYSNFGFVTLTLILEKVTGIAYSELLKEYITDKYEIDLLNTNLKMRQEENYVTPYFPELKLLKGEDLDYGKQNLTSGIFANTKSLSQLMSFQLTEYQSVDSIKNKSPLVLNREKINSWSQNSYYGYGIFEHHFVVQGREEIEHVKLEHGGDADGFACCYSFFPEYGFGIVILTSSGGKWLADMEKNISNLLILEHFDEK